MDIKSIRKDVAKIAELRSDDELAHSAEDALFLAFVEHVAAHGSPELSDMAIEVLESKNIIFCRWYA